jgi:hypothetical protein
VESTYWNFGSIYGSREVLYRFGQVTPDETLTPLPTATSDKIRSYAELKKFIRFSLRVQNPGWIEPNGDSPLCDSYEARFATLLGLTYPLESDAGRLENHLQLTYRPNLFIL